MNPNFIRSAAEFRAELCVGGDDPSTESEVLDFKAGLRRPEGKVDLLELSRDISQFSDTHGGCLLFGVKEKKDPDTGRVAATSVCGIKDAGKVRRSITDAVNRYLVPSTIVYDVADFRVEDNTVIAVNITASIPAVVVWDEPRMEALYRTSFGKRYMNPDDVQRHMANTTRELELRWRQIAATTEKLQVHRYPTIYGVNGQPIARRPGFLFEGFTNGGILLGLYIKWEERYRGVDVPFASMTAVWENSSGDVSMLVDADVHSITTGPTILAPRGAGSLV